MDTRVSRGHMNGQMIIESLIVTLVLGALLVMLGFFFKKSDKSAGRYQFQEVSRDR